MKCKIFTGKDGYLVQGIAATPVKMEDSINKFLEQFEGNNTEHLRILQSQSSDGGHPIVTITIFY